MKNIEIDKQQQQAVERNPKAKPRATRGSLAVPVDILDKIEVGQNILLEKSKIKQQHRVNMKRATKTTIDQDRGKNCPATGPDSTGNLLKPHKYFQ